MLDNSVSVFVSENETHYKYITVLGNVVFKVPKWPTFSPRYNGGTIPNQIVAKYILAALDGEEID